MKIVLDTFAWIELFSGSQYSSRVKELSAGNQIGTAMPSLSELASWALRSGYDAGAVVAEVTRTSKLLDFTPVIAQKAGTLHVEARKTQPTFGMVDAMIYATALTNGAHLLTGDPHFTGKPGVVML